MPPNCTVIQTLQFGAVSEVKMMWRIYNYIKPVALRSLIKHGKSVIDRLLDSTAEISYNLSFYISFQILLFMFNSKLLLGYHAPDLLCISLNQLIPKAIVLLLTGLLGFGFFSSFQIEVIVRVHRANATPERNTMNIPYIDSSSSTPVPVDTSEP